MFYSQTVNQWRYRTDEEDLLMDRQTNRQTAIQTDRQVTVHLAPKSISPEPEVDQPHIRQLLVVA